MIERLRRRQEWILFGALFRAAPSQSVVWWAGLVVRGALPALIAVASGWLIAAVTDGEPLTAPLVALAVVFVAAQVVGPLHEVVGSNLGERTATSLNDRLMAATLEPPGVAHLERADLTDDLTMARDFDLGITGPPLSYAMNFIADGFVGLFTGIASAIVLAWYGWWQALLLVLAWSATHWLLRESAIWRDRRTPEVLHAAAPRRVRLPPGGRPAGGQGGAPVRPRRLGHRALHRPAPPALRPAVRGDPTAREVGARVPGHRARRQPRRVLVARRPRRRRAARAWRRRSSPCRPPSGSARSPSAGSTGRSTAPPRRPPPSPGWRT